MSTMDESTHRDLTEQYGQSHLFDFWEDLNHNEKAILLRSISEVKFPEMKRLIESLVVTEPPAEYYDEIKPVDLVAPKDRRAREAGDAGEALIRAGKVACFTVAGGQGTRLGFDGPKGSYPIGALTGHSLFQYHAEKIRGLQRYYGTVLPWYIMVSPANGDATRAFFKQQNYFALDPANILFFEQQMIPCVNEKGKMMLETPFRLAVSPGGHGGSVQALVEKGILADAASRGVEILSYFQVDNWAVQVADPLFIGYHALQQSDMSSKCHRRNSPREAVGVHCLCDQVYRVIEYSELDIYPQLLQVDASGDAVFSAGNSGIHLLNVSFVQDIYDHFEDFPWHKAFKKIPCIREDGTLFSPDAPNGYKFETFIFDALRFARNPLALEIQRLGEYTPIKDYDGVNSVVAARQSMTDYWSGWMKGAGIAIPEQSGSNAAWQLEISPAWAVNREEFAERAQTLPKSFDKSTAILADGTILGK
ncbi:MAG TPA: UTP--glucose-1-phosphate uridylyltransferase [Candidatus Hydrogenedentes bacterium]|nr:UTP--glucose-1-phosphate uridylyltransferase [Candidatus Hydrogenedentota bacterium]